MPELIVDAILAVLVVSALTLGWLVGCWLSPYKEDDE